ncbi:hypothetical protein GGR54DRAFT_592523 [Hypoxylon sp. NC1633]|nr:hypothetical protein GGR54DRAFT_592523 [Hypoxylon sp. NC1633]
MNFRTLSSLFLLSIFQLAPAEDADVANGPEDIKLLGSGYWGDKYNLPQEACKAVDENTNRVSVQCYYDIDQTQGQNFLNYFVKIPDVGIPPDQRVNWAHDIRVQAFQNFYSDCPDTPWNIVTADIKPFPNDENQGLDLNLHLTGYPKGNEFRACIAWASRVRTCNTTLFEYYKGGCFKRCDLWNDNKGGPTQTKCYDTLGLGQ